ncbi:signal peptidase I [Altererythrobacter atlanticus]|uniref:Signal peptidase I n=1 Tax=Croceibacterium atlanticum TaxID=1267766 RepID=A0A0F7KSQ5_9SPHN|nr:signal peptidase I [Croceibacterium atlanticum]AKH41790.1 Signal peptidase I [Croceibacterium atlanticum]MBB5733255.1 signal peptidase I [Croceibacterium atlanticum]
MSETPTAEKPQAAPNAKTGKPDNQPARPEKKEEGSFLVFLLKLVIVVTIFRTFVFSSHSIPSESMMPDLLEGDFLFAAKWPYGYSQASMPFDIQLWSGRIPDGIPDRGDVVIFKHPVDRADYVKRVIGLPGDQIQMIAGVVHINGQAVKKERIEDLVIHTSTSEGCRVNEFTERQADGGFICSYPQFRETLPGGETYNVLDFGITPKDTTDPVIVPDDMLFMMGDNRDNSMDSRYPAVPGGGVGLVPVENVVGRAGFIFFSTDGTASWFKPWTWFTAARWSRIGNGI